MKKKCFHSFKKAFTLLELLVVTAVILILIAYFVANSSSGIEKAKFAKQQFQLAKIAEAIRLFEQDWGELPPDLSLLINPYGLLQYAESKGVNIAPKAYLDGPKNHCMRLTWINDTKPNTKYSDLSYFTAVSTKNSSGTQNNVHYIYDLLNNTVNSTLGNDKNIWGDTGIQTFHSNTYALMDIWKTPVYYRPYSNGKFALFSAGPDKIASITDYSKNIKNSDGTTTTLTEWVLDSNKTFSNSEIKDPTKQDPFANPKEILILLDTSVSEVKMDSQNNYNKDNIIYSPLQ